MNKVFVKVARSKQEPGKGGFWKLELARLQDSRRCKRVSRPSKKQKAKNEDKQSEKNVSIEIHMLQQTGPYDDSFERAKQASDSISDLSSQLPDFSLDGLDMVLSNPMETDFGPNVIVEPVAAEEELGALLMSTPWEDLQPELTDSLFDSYLK